MQLTKQGAVLFAQGSHKRFRSQSTQHAGQTGGHAPYLIVCEDMRRAWPRANDGNIRQSKTFEDPFRHPFRPLLPNIARVRARPCGRFRERCVFGNERSLVANGCEDAPSMTPLGIAPAASPHALAHFFGSCRGKPLSNVSDEAKPPLNAKRGRTRRSSLS